MTNADKAEFLEKTKQATINEQGVPWEFMEAKILEDIENTFDDDTPEKSLGTRNRSLWITYCGC